MKIIEYWGKFWKFLKEDTWQSWVVSLILAFVIIKFVFFPVLSFVLAAPLPLVVVESCSMYHDSDIDDWFSRNGAWYSDKEIGKAEFEVFPFKNGINKGDIILVSGRGDFGIGDVIIFDSGVRFPLIHRVVELDPVGTKGDKNNAQLDTEKEIKGERILGKSVARIPGLGWFKLIFFERSKPENERGFCK